MSLVVYADRALGAYGFVEKPWFLPHVRLDLFLAELERRDCGVTLASAPAASDADLTLFHTPEHVRAVTERCARNVGSVDEASAGVADRVRALLRGVSAVSETDPVPLSALDEVLAQQGSSFDDWRGFLDSEGLVLATDGTVALTEQGRRVLHDPQARIGGPTFARSSVEEAARGVCGAAAHAARRLVDGEIARAFLPVSGFHHAHPERAQNYCLYNDPGVAIAAALERTEGVVVYVDVDIHHGDGVYAGFADEPRVVIADVHADPEQRDGARVVEALSDGDRTLALALGPGTDDAGYLEAFAQVESLIQLHRPALVVFEAGVDGLSTDPMSNQAITASAIREVTQRLVAYAERHGVGMLVLAGGGYEAESSARAWGEVVEVLASSEP